MSLRRGDLDLWRSARLVVVLALLTVVGCACSDSDKPPAQPAPASPTATTSPGPTVVPEAASAEAQARAAFTGFVQTWAIASQANDSDNPDLARYTADPLLSKTRNDISVVRSKGAVQVGAQTAAVLGATVNLAGAPPTVTLNTCLDYTQLKLVYLSNGSPVPGSDIAQPKVSAVATVTRYTTGQWLVSDLTRVSGSC